MWPLFTILPWEAAVRARFGKHLALLQPGVHFRIPFFDVVQTVNTKLRIVHTEPQTITTKDGRSLVVAMTVGFRIVDPLAATMRHHMPEWAVRSIAQGLIAQNVATADSANLAPGDLGSLVLNELKENGAGYEYDLCTVSEFGYLRTLRLLQSNGSPYSPAIEERHI